LQPQTNETTDFPSARVSSHAPHLQEIFAPFSVDDMSDTSQAKLTLSRNSPDGLATSIVSLKA
jgi:hypothetical protein